MGTTTLHYYLFVLQKGLSSRLQRLWERRRGRGSRLCQSMPQPNAATSTRTAGFRAREGGEGHLRACSLARRCCSSWAGGSRRAGAIGRESRRRRRTRRRTPPCRQDMSCCRNCCSRHCSGPRKACTSNSCRQRVTTRCCKQCVLGAK